MGYCPERITKKTKHNRFFITSNPKIIFLILLLLEVSISFDIYRTKQIPRSLSFRVEVLSNSLLLLGYCSCINYNLLIAVDSEDDYPFDFHPTVAAAIAAAAVASQPSEQPAY